MKKSLIFVFSVALAFTVGCKTSTKPVVLPAETDGSYGTKGTYVLFGKWPQSLKADDVTVSPNKEDVNNWECYKGSDGCYYVKTEAEPNSNDYEFDNGESIVEGKSYYFKLEPIKWRVVTDDYQGGKLLVAENILEGRLYDSGNDNNYKNSEIRAWLNNDFINSAFTKDAIENINTIIVDNSVKSTGYSENEFVCENTEDKIFLLSHEEVTKSSYGFSSKRKEDTARRRKTTDYSRATGAFSETCEEYKNNGWWWLRSPYIDYSDHVCDVDLDGFSDYYVYARDSSEGVVPALSMNF